jgi:CRISPR-associated protein Cas2
MYVVVVYDVEQRRVAKVCQLLRRYLSWVQNSAFEGELTEAQLERLRFELCDVIDPAYDSVYIYRWRDRSLCQKQVLGQEKSLSEPFVE